MEISLLTAFFGGLISLLSPCSALVLPGFLANSFSNRKKLLFATFIFSLGVLTIVVPLGLSLFAIVSFFTLYRQTLTFIIGIILLLEGILQLFNRSLFSFNHLSQISRFKGFFSSYYLGLVSGIGATSCVGPILGAIITLGAFTGNSFKTIQLILAYTSGLIIPLFILALLYQTNQSKTRQLLKGKVIKIKHYQLHLVNLFASLFFLFLSFIFIKHQGSLTFINPNYFFALQDKLFNL